MTIARRGETPHNRAVVADRVYTKGDVIGDRFELGAPLGKGAFGVVWKAVDRQRPDTPAAVKILFDRFASDKKMLGRFVQEAKILERLDHAAILRPIAWDVEGDEPFLATEFIDGETLDKRLETSSRESRPIPLQGVAWIADQMCSAIAYAHQHSVVHRDLKPKNVMVNSQGARPFVKVLDFGIAKMLVGSELDPTTVGRVLGSVLYISPEQVLGKAIDHRADIFSLGTILFEVLTLRRAWARTREGRPFPFHVAIPADEINGHVAVLKRIAKEPRPRASRERDDIPNVVDEVLWKAMAISPAERYESAEDLAKSFREALLEPDARLAGLPSSTTRSDRPTAIPPIAVPRIGSVRAPNAMSEGAEEGATGPRSPGASPAIFGAVLALLAVLVVVLAYLFLGR